jgi:hypothetical protein
MGESGMKDTVAPPGEATVLRHEPSRREILLGIDLPGALYLAFFIHFALVSLGCSYDVAAPLAVAMSFLFSVTIARLVSGTKLMIVDDGKIIFQGLRKKEITLGEIERVALQKWGEWGPARVVLEMRRTKPRSFWRLDLTMRSVALPGNVHFQAEVVDAILERRPDLAVDERALKLLAGQLRVLVRHRLPTLVASGIGAATLAVFLAASYRDTFIWFWWLFPLVLPAFAVPLTHCLERESPGKRAIASLGVSALPPLAMASMLPLLYGGQEYVPLLQAAGLALAVGAFVAALPRSPSAGTVAAGTATLLAALVGLTWHVTLADTIPVREVLLDPPPWSATFSPEGRTAISDASPIADAWGETAAVHFTDVHTLETETVALGPNAEGAHWVTALDDHRALMWGYVRNKEGVWLVATGRQPKRMGIPGETARLWHRARSPDGSQFAIYQTQEILTPETPPDSRPQYTSRFLLLDMATGVADVAPFKQHPAHRHVGGLRWNSDGRLVWGGVEPDKQREHDLPTGTLRLWSWAPGEDEPRMDFESREMWSNVGMSPRWDKAVTHIHRNGSRTPAVVSFADGRVTEIPGLEPRRALHPSAHWSEDASVYVFVPEAEPRTIRILRTATGKVSTLCRAPAGEVRGTLVSPDGRRVAFTVERGFQKTVHIVDTVGGRSRRLRPMGGLTLLGYLQGSASWSADGRWLAIPAFGSRLALTGSSGKGPLWLVSADDM